MTTYYVDSARADDTGNGLTIATAKKTLNGAEDIPVAAGDLVHVRQGTYRELLTIDVSGTAGNPIEYRGDYTGVIFGDAFGGVVRITGSNNDQAATRANCITATSKNYRTFRGFHIDLTTSDAVQIPTCNNIITELCVIADSNTYGVYWDVSGSSNNIVRLCVIHRTTLAPIINWSAALQAGNPGHLVENCILGDNALVSASILASNGGGMTIRNCILHGAGYGVSSQQTGAAPITVNNCILFALGTALSAVAVGDIVEDYNSLSRNTVNRVNTNTGPNSNNYPPLFDPRPWFQLMHAQAAAQLVSPFDLASFSQLVNLAGTAPPATDLRGQAILGAQREWGALEYNANLGFQDRKARPRYQTGM